MAPARTRKAKASPSDTASNGSRALAIKSPARTPIASPSKRGLTPTGITASQKQALIDNLQLEVTERARKLRAQYALQAQSLRTRLEMRINRIPSGLRKMKMGDLYEKYMQMDAAANSRVASVSRHANHEVDSNDFIDAPQQGNLNSRTQPIIPPMMPATNISPTAPPLGGLKRTSETFDSDKENPTTTTTTTTTATVSTEAKPIPNKKQRTTAKDSSHPSRQNPNPSNILSPKSANSRTIPTHHSKGDGPRQKTQHTTRPTSPLKAQTSPVKTTTAAVGGRSAKSAASIATATGTLTKMAGAPPQPQASKSRRRKAAGAAAAAGTVEIRDEGSVRTVSNASNASTGTTIVKKSKGEVAKRGRAKTAKATIEKKTVAATASGGEEKNGTKGGRRVLRKR